MDEITSQQIAPAADPTSWIILILFSLFLLACFRVRGNLKFVGSFFSDLVTVRERDNLFDTTVRETSLIFMMLLLSGCSFGVLLRQGVELFGDRLQCIAVLFPKPLEVLCPFDLHIRSLSPVFRLHRTKRIARSL